MNTTDVLSSTQELATRKVDGLHVGLLVRIRARVVSGRRVRAAAAVTERNG
jgi:hypothetical protein